MGKAAWGALMGLGQGISQYGTAMGANALAEQQAKREFDRQKSLQEISQRYRRDFAIEQLDPNTELGRLTQENQDRSLKQQFDPNDPMFQMAEARRKELLAEKVDPNNPIYQQTEAERKRLMDEQHAQQVELRNINPYGGYGSQGEGLFSTINPANYTPESFKPWVQEVNRLMTEEGMTPDQAARAAMSAFPLEPRESSANAGETATNKTMMDDFKAFKEQNPGEEDMRQALLSMGFSEQELAGKTRQQLLTMYQSMLQEEYQPFMPGGLMNQGTQPGFRVDPNNIPSGQPGSSRENPVDATQFSAPPPSGTWVRLPDGSVRQVP